MILLLFFFFFKQNTAYEMRISDWSSDVCSSDLTQPVQGAQSLSVRRDSALRRRRLTSKWFGGRAWAEFGAPAAYLQPCQKFRLSYYSLTLHSYAGSVFRSPAPDDVTAVPQKLSLGVLMGLADPPGHDGEQLRLAQFRSVDRLGGIYFLFPSLAVVFVFGGFAGSVRLPALRSEVRR